MPPVTGFGHDVTGEIDALRLLKLDHREIITLFGEYEDAKEDGATEALAADICEALPVHSTPRSKRRYSSPGAVGCICPRQSGRVTLANYEERQTWVLGY